MGKIDKNFTIYDNYVQTRLDIFYDKVKPEYPKHARNALPILIERAKKGGPPIGYHELGEMLGIPFFRRRAQYIGNYVCACISTTFYKWEQNTGKKLLRLVNIVSSEDSLTRENNYVRKGLKRALGREPTWDDYERKLLPPIYTCKAWDEVLNTIELAKA